MIQACSPRPPRLHGALLPAARGDQRGAGDARRHQRRVDPHPHRHPRAPHRRQGHAAPPTWPPPPRASPWSAPDVEPEEIDMILLSTATPDRLLPVHRLRRAGAAGRPQRRRVRLRHGVLAASCTACRWRRRTSSAGQAETVLVCATEKMSSIVDWTDRADLRPLRRRRGRDGGQARHGRARHPLQLHEERRHAGGAAVPPRRRRAHPAGHRRAGRALALREDGGPRGLQVRRARHVRRGRDGAAARGRHERTRSTCWCRTRPTSASSRRPPSTPRCPWTRCS